ncbi:MAG TPA: peroxiredoxin [Nitrospinae bacterium]|jgi:peroxiredoxin Q/BCP|nr:peroxiredoxin [Nitrospinota bacterium]|tara:strand:+ start:286 stop:723 length:438 start_codon:yes stop_codon:yes gene_type:complete
MLQPGTDAPAFSINDHNGNLINLKDYLGKKIVLWFYPKADTPGCTMEGQGFRDDFKKFEAKGIQVFGVSLDNEKDNKAFAEKFSFSYPLLCDVNKEIALAYQAIKSADDQYAARISYVIGEDGKILESIESVDTKNHSNDLCSRY